MSDSDLLTGLAALFLAHAAGGRTERALEERRVEILQYLAANKYTLTKAEVEPLREELAVIGLQLEGYHGAA